MLDLPVKSQSLRHRKKMKPFFLIQATTTMSELQGEPGPNIKAGANLRLRVAKDFTVRFQAYAWRGNTS